VIQARKFTDVMVTNVNRKMRTTHLQCGFDNSSKGVHAFACYYSPRSYALAEYCIHFKARFGGVHAFGYNSAESEPIWMKCRAL